MVFGNGSSTCNMRLQVRYLRNYKVYNAYLSDAWSASPLRCEHAAPHLPDGEACVGVEAVPLVDVADGRLHAGLVVVLVQVELLEHRRAEKDDRNIS